MKEVCPKIHPALRHVAKKSPKITFHRKNLWLISFLLRLMPATRCPEDVLVKNSFILGLDGRRKVRLRMYKPRTVDAPIPALIWLHGGGYVTGKPEMDDWLCAEYARKLGILVVSVDYRLAPRYPFPSGLDDSYSALKWVASHSHQLGIDADHVAIGGASAGGGLAAALVHLAHDEQEITPVFQLLVYPMLDDKTSLRTDIDDSNNVTWNHKSNRFGWECYLERRRGDDDINAYSVPARREDLSGLPPAWIGVGSLDIFHDEDVAYARRMKECGVECELEIVPGAFHGFDLFDHEVPVVQEFRRSQLAALRRHLWGARASP
ncbi:MAG: alpha/beta hydrolase [Candidatus Lokiarchaeota archaeon]|nr:alpha/beta hydrolase [Candidatus Lokiarchaeota archaeon]